jgi:hypothetical protein
MRTLPVWAALAAMPFSGLQVVCFEMPAARAAVIAHGAEADCEHMCVRHQQDADDSGCLLTSSPISSPAPGLPVAPPEPVGIGPVVVHEFGDTLSLYVPPGLAFPSPPPEA